MTDLVGYSGGPADGTIQPPPPETDEDTPTTPREYAKKALEKAGGDQAKAHALLADMIKDDDRVYREYVESIFLGGCRVLIASVASDARQRSWGLGSKHSDRPGISEESKAQILAEANLLMYPLSIGKLLKDANREEVILEADYLEKKASSLAHKVRWLRAIAQEMKPRKRVDKCLSQADLRRIQEETQNVQ